MKLKIISVCAAGALLLAAAPGVRAQVTSTTKGTLAGQDVVNTASVKYSVGGVEQTTPAVGDVTFKVDRKVVLAVTESGSAVTSVAPGATNKALRFDVTNDSNDFIDIALVASDTTVPASPATGEVFKGGGGTANETATKETGATFTLYLDVNDDGAFTAGTDTALPVSGTAYLDGVAPGDTVAVLVVADEMPDDSVLVDGDVMVVKLVGTAHSAYANQRLPTTGTSGTSETEKAVVALATAGTPLISATLGAVLVDNASAGDVATEVDNVMADVDDTTEATGDPAGDGKDTSYDAYKVATAAITVAKTYGVISDGVSVIANGDSPKPIPGATVLYCITVANGSATTDATDVTITDSIPDGTTYKPGTIRVVANLAKDCANETIDASDEGTAMTDVVDTPTPDAADFTGNVVTSKVNVAAGDSTTTMFQVTIN